MARRLLASYLALVTLVLVMLGIPFVQTIRRDENASLRTDLERDGVIISSAVEDLLHHDPLSESERAVAARLVDQYESKTGARIVIVDRRGVSVADSEPPSDGTRSFSTRPEIIQALKGSVSSIKRYSSTLGYSSLYVAVPIGSGSEVTGAVRVSYSTSEMNARIRLRLYAVATVAAIASLVAGLVAYMMSRTLANPIKLLGDAARQFGSGNLRTRSSVHSGPPEVRALARDFDVMASRLEELVQSQQHFVSDASHQLRTPLTALGLRLEAMDPDNPASVESHRQAATEEIGRLSRIVDGLLALARPDRTGPAAELVDLSAVAQERLEFWLPLAEEADVKLQMVMPVRGGVGQLGAKANAERVAQILDNLVANALDVSPAGSTIEFVCERRMRASGDLVRISIRDQGPGMSDEMKNRAFDRFWTSGSAEKNYGGSGLGLAIARKLAGLDRGTLELTDAPGRGLEAAVCYPAA